MENTVTVFRLSENAGIVTLSIGECNKDTMQSGRAAPDTVHETGCVDFPISLLAAISKHMIALGTKYQSEHGNIGFDVADDNGSSVIRI